MEPREGITVPLPIGTPIYLEPKTHTLVEIGFIGAKEVYLDVPREEAIRRYAEANDGMEGVTITEHTVGDVFGAYEIYGT